ncbi:hypothetical protein AOC36_03285 [Erysipelothrix larvae]|uniref:Anhydro-N-acetylmuramic acid kinase n=1 Tax=Erysipelothrix larvae TaxID=1514105 RepID=A0A0X8GZ07_9FIRM|nr:anhydro-N-acetylmuramic acid kinase AnmK [Erysipelothrix larvae]AMC93039.1 hypothetical protein AOC36_03285 [Erysipelothrix larvae]
MLFHDKDTVIGLGIMSGTSLDGIDVASVLFDKGRCTLRHFESYPIDDDLKQKILDACNPETSGVDTICSLNFELGKTIAQCVETFQHTYHEPLDFIATHGQTLYHIPSSTDHLVRSTLQIGEPSYLAYQFGVPVVSNFRVMDMVAGGEGAPLVPFTEKILFYDEQVTTCIQNIGGIGNVSVISKDKQKEVIAFDTGPGNMWMNAAMQAFYKKPYDKDGAIAQMGSEIPELMQDLICDPYFNITPPKSTGREYFSEAKVHAFCKRYCDRQEDLIHTLTKFTAYSIYRSYQDYILPHETIDRIVLCGGGAYNKTLVSMIQAYFKNNALSVVTMEDLGYSSDAKEALAFALLGYNTLLGNVNNCPSATGAKEQVICGMITPPHRRNT